MNKNRIFLIGLALFTFAILAHLPSSTAFEGCPTDVYLNPTHSKYDPSAIQCLDQVITNCENQKTILWYELGPLELSFVSIPNDECFIEIAQQDWDDYGLRISECYVPLDSLENWHSWKNPDGYSYFDDLEEGNYCNLTPQEMTPQIRDQMLENKESFSKEMTSYPEELTTEQMDQMQKFFEESEFYNSEGMSLESIEFFRTLYFAKLVSMINQNIQSLPDDVFFDSTSKDNFQEILVSGDDNIYDLFSKSNFFYFDAKENINNFYEATTKLSELKTRMDSSIGGNPSDDWIEDQNSQNLVLEIIDYALDEYMQSVGGNLNPVSVEDYDENWWNSIKKYQKNAEPPLLYLCFSESFKKLPSNEYTPMNFEIPECQTFIPKSLSIPTQIRIGVPPEKIQCDDGLKLIFKSTDGSPACVKPTTAEKLIERGWALG